MLKIYTLPGCHECEKLTKRLDSENIKYERVNIGKPGNIAIKKKMNPQTPTNDITIEIQVF